MGLGSIGQALREARVAEALDWLRQAGMRVIGLGGPTRAEGSAWADGQQTVTASLTRAGRQEYHQVAFV